MAEAIIRSAQSDDAEELARIYNHYITRTCVTFETEEISAGDMASRIGEAAAQSLPYLVAELDSELVGFAYASRWKGRCAYRYSVESTIYLDPTRTGNGTGTALYAALLDEIREIGMHAVIGGISLPNPASVRLHEKLGFRKAGHFDQVGFKFDQWVDVGYWQLTF